MCAHLGVCKDWDHCSQVSLCPLGWSGVNVLGIEAAAVSLQSKHSTGFSNKKQQPHDDMLYAHCSMPCSGG